MMHTRWARVTALVCGAALVGAVGCSKSSDNGNKGSAESTTPTAPAEARAPAPVPKLAVKTAPAPTAGAAKTRNETKEYVIELLSPAEFSAGAEGAVTVKVHPKKGWHFNLDFPTSVKVEAPDGLKLAKAVQNLDDATSKSEEEGATWAIKVTPEKAGAATLKCNVKFAVCTETTCDPKKETLALTLDAK